jgi:hypothetical protein
LCEQLLIPFSRYVPTIGKNRLDRVSILKYKRTRRFGARFAEPDVDKEIHVRLPNSFWTLVSRSVVKIANVRQIVK